MVSVGCEGISAAVSYSCADAPAARVGHTVVQLLVVYLRSLHIKGCRVIVQFAAYTLRYT